MQAPSAAPSPGALEMPVPGRHAPVHGGDVPERARAIEGTWAGGHPHASACLTRGSAHGMTIHVDLREPVLASGPRAVGLPG